MQAARSCTDADSHPFPTATATPTPKPSPTPEPTPYVSRKPIEIGKIFNGLTLENKFETPKSEALASIEREDKDSYKVQVTITAKLPRPECHPGRPGR